MTVSRLRLSRLALSLTLGAALVPTVLAQTPAAFPTAEEAARVNERTVGIVFSREALFVDLVEDLESELEVGGELRIVPMLGKNHVQSVYDLLYLKGVDLALARADALEYVRSVGGMPSVQRLTHNVARISDEKIVVLAGEKYESMADLDGERVAVGTAGSGESVTAALVFERLGIEPETVTLDSAAALEKVRSGELAAMVHLLRAPGAFPDSEPLEGDTPEPVDAAGLRVLELPPGEELSSLYRPTTLDAKDLPGLLPPGTTLLSSSVDVNLLAYAWRRPNARSRKLEKFLVALVERLETLQGEEAYQPAWRAVSLTDETPSLYNSPTVARALAERAATKQRLLDAEALARRQAAEEKRRVAELEERRERTIERLGEELTERDTAKMERLLDQLDTLLLEEGEGEAPTAAAAQPASD